MTGAIFNRLPQKLAAQIKTKTRHFLLPDTIYFACSIDGNKIEWLKVFQFLLFYRTQKSNEINSFIIKYSAYGCTLLHASATKFRPNR